MYAAPNYWLESFTPPDYFTRLFQLELGHGRLQILPLTLWRPLLSPLINHLIPKMISLLFSRSI
jgi:hypothetical protein